MGNESSNPIRNMDKRTARREYRDHFKKAIADFQVSNGIYDNVGSNSGGKQDEGSVQHELRFDEESKNNVRVLVRKRPIFQHEEDAHEFDVVSCVGGRTAVIHDTRMHADMRRMLITNNAFVFDGVFNQKSSNEMVYRSACMPLVQQAVRGGYSTVCVYGQTGSGKSFTMTSFYERAARDIFAELDAMNDRMYDLPRISLSFFELQGDLCLDLLNAFQPTQLLTAADGGVHASPVVEPTVTSADEMIGLIRHAISIRSTSATGVHDASSRSHAILRIYIAQPPVDMEPGEKMLRRDQFLPIPPPQINEGVLTLVDLAGSEQSIDSMYHTAELRKEGAAINSSLMALKDCIRAKASGNTASHIYRKSKLTMALKDSLTMPSARTVIVATVSPSSKDTEHSLNTLRHACLMDGQTPQGDETRFMTGGIKSETYQVGEVDVSSISKKNRELKKKGLAPEANTSNGNYLGNEVSNARGPVKKPPPELTEKQKAKARRIADRTGLHRMEAKLCATLLAHRESLGQEEQQIRRMKRTQSPYVKDAPDISTSSPPAPSIVPAGVAEMIQGQRQIALSHDPTNHQFESGEAENADSIENGEEVLTRRALSPRVLAPTKSSNMRTSITNELRSSREWQKKQHEAAALQQLEEEEDPELEEYVRERMRVQEAGTSRDIGAYLEQNIQNAPRHAHKTQPEVEPPGDQRTPFYKLYIQIYGRNVEYHDQESKAILNRQLQTLLRMHGYAEDEIEELLASGRPAMPKRKPPVKAPVVTPMESANITEEPKRQSHMSSYGGAANADGARTETVHQTLQSNEQKRANVTRQPPQDRTNKNNLAVKSAAEKLEIEAKIREERRARAKAILTAKQQAARQKNREDLADMTSLQLAHAQEEVEKQAAFAAQRRENALRLREERENEHKRNALSKLNAKGFDTTLDAHTEVDAPTSPRIRQGSPPVPGRRKVVDTTAEDAEIARVTRLVVQARYQPQEVQMRLKKQLQIMKVNRTRKVKGEPLLTPAETGNSSPRPGSAGTARPSSAGALAVASAKSRSMTQRQSTSRDGVSPRSSQDYAMMPAQLRKEVSDSSHFDEGSMSPEHKDRAFIEKNEEVDWRQYGKHGTLRVGLGQASQGAFDSYNHTAKKMSPTSKTAALDENLSGTFQDVPVAAKPNSVHVHGRPVDGRGNYRVGASAAPFGNALNS